MIGSAHQPPTPHLAEAALHVGQIVGDSATVTEIRESYWRRVSAGVFSYDDFQAGERLLIGLGMLYPDGDRLHATALLQQLALGDLRAGAVAILVSAAAEGDDRNVVLAAMNQAETSDGIDGDLRDRILLQLGRTYDDLIAKEVGLAGEVIVVAALRDELTSLGRADLAQQVRQVSLESDQLGYDIWAPRLSGDPRLIEVKTTTASVECEAVEVQISRNEILTGAERPNWLLLICEIASVDDMSPQRFRWCRADALLSLSPVDTRNSAWTSTKLSVPAVELRDGLPTAVA